MKISFKDVFKPGVKKVPETYDQRMERIRKSTETAERLQKERAAESLATQHRREAQAQAFRARAVLVRQRLTPSPIVIEAAKATGRGAVVAGRTTYQVGRVVGREGLKVLSNISAAQQARMAAGESITGDLALFTLGTRPPNPSNTWNTLEAAFGYGPFTLPQANKVVTSTLLVTPANASILIRSLQNYGNIVVQPPIRMEIRPMGNLNREIFG